MLSAVIVEVGLLKGEVNSFTCFQGLDGRLAYSYSSRQSGGDYHGINAVMV